MERNEIKKLLYKERPIAELCGVSKDGISYTAFLEETDNLYFLVPLNEIGDTVWKDQMEAKLLIRYLQ